MASTFSTNLALELIGTGDQAGTWGITTNTNLGTLIEQAISGYVTQAVATGTDTTITIPDGATGVARNMYIELTGTGGASTNLIVPANKKLYFIFNNSTGAVTVKVSGQTGVSVPQGKKMVLVSNGTDIVTATNYVADFGSNSATITQLTSTSATITNLTLTSLVLSNLSIASANVTTLTSASATITNLLATSLTVSGNTFLATSSGNVGIGTTSPANYANYRNLAISGTTGANIDMLSGSTKVGNLFNDGTNFYAYNVIAGALVFGTNNAERARFDSSGNLGIGTSSPGYKLTVNGFTTVSGTQAAIKQVAETNAFAGIAVQRSANDSTLGLAFNSTADAWQISASYASSGAYKPIQFLTSDTVRATLDSSGNLGIGTSSPVTKLNVVDSTTNNYVAAFRGVGGTNLVALGTTSGGASIAGYTAGFAAATDLIINPNAGNLGLGVTPSAWGSGQRAIDLAAWAALSVDTVANAAYSMSWNAYALTYNSWKYKNGTTASRYEQAGGSHAWYNAPSGTAGNDITFTQAMTLNADGKLSIGTTSAPSGSGVRAVISNANGGGLQFDQSGSGGAVLPNGGSAGLQFFTYTGGVGSESYTERARITSGGYSKFSNDGVYADSAGTFHEFRNTANDHCLIVRGTNASQTIDVFVVQGARNTTDNTYYVIQYYNTGAAATRFRVADSGNVTNTNGSYGTISDAKMKTDIVDAGSQWDDLKAVRFRKFKMKDDPSGLMQLGVVAQELEQTSPGLVEEHKDIDAEGNDLGTTTKSVKTSVLLMKAAVALQEAMARIEQLEAKVAALETK